MSYFDKVKVQRGVSGYTVLANEDFSPGTIIEEMPVLVTSTHVEACTDKILLSKAVVSKTKNDENLLSIPVGNFMAYRQDLNANCAINIDTRFNLLTIRALGFIKKDDELVIESTENEFGHSGIPIFPEERELPQDKHIDSKTISKIHKEISKQKDNSMGCGCGKKKQVQKILDGTEEKKPKEPDVSPEMEKQINDNFKSMVDGKTHKAIVAKRKS